MNNLQYEFLSYECFPDDAYVTEVVMVCFGGLLIVPYKNAKTKNGGHFWCFPGVSATRNGDKKNFNCEFDSKSFKLKFDNEVENFIRTRTAFGKHEAFGITQATQDNATQPKLEAFYPQDFQGTAGSVYSGAPNDNGLPF